MIAATSAAVVKAVQAKLEKEGTSMTSIMEHSAQYRIQIFSLKFDVKYRDSPVSAVP